MKVLNLYAGIGGNRMLWGNDNAYTDVRDDVRAMEKEYGLDLSQFKGTTDIRKCLRNMVKPADGKFIFEQLTKTLRMDKEFAEDECVRLQNELGRTKRALEIAVDALKDIDKTRSVANHKIGTQDKTLNSGIVFCWTTPDEIHNTLEQITVLKKSELENLEMLVNNVFK